MYLVYFEIDDLDVLINFICPSEHPCNTVDEVMEPDGHQLFNFYRIVVGVN